MRDAGAVRAIVARGLVPRCLELLDSTTLEAVRNKGVAIDSRAGAMLLIEVDGEPTTCDVELERVGHAWVPKRKPSRCSSHKMRHSEIASESSQRDVSSGARLTKNKLSEDVVVPRSRLVDLLTEVDRISEASVRGMLSYGHAGDGNLHVNFCGTIPMSCTRLIAPSRCSSGAS
ncbi:MAG: FAD-linked oxidase C-terminal domain-containing protein [Polyangiaceae bacterium]